LLQKTIFLPFEKISNLLKISGQNIFGIQAWSGGWVSEKQLRLSRNYSSGPVEKKNYSLPQQKSNPSGSYGIHKNTGPVIQRFSANSRIIGVHYPMIKPNSWHPSIKTAWRNYSQVGY